MRIFVFFCFSSCFIPFRKFLVAVARNKSHLESFFVCVFSHQKAQFSKVAFCVSVFRGNRSKVRVHHGAISPSPEDGARERAYKGFTEQLLAIGSVGKAIWLRVSSSGVTVAS